MQRKLNLANMAQNAIEALGELTGTLDRIRFQQRLPSINGRYDAPMAYNARRHPLTDWGLFVSFEHALHHLNWSWNDRYLSDEEIKLGTRMEMMISRPRFCEANNELTTARGRRVIPVAAPMHVRYVNEWANKRLHPIADDSSARMAARALSMHPLFALSPELQDRFSFVFYVDFAVRAKYCREKREGWRDLQWTLGEFLRSAAYWREYHEHDELEQVFAVQGAQEFCRRLSIAGRRLAMKHIRMMVDWGSFDLLQDLFAKVPEAWKLLSPRDLLFWVCADGRFKDEAAVRMVKMIESRQPGIVAGTVDVFGDTPLWYTLYRYQYGGHVDSCGWREHTPKLSRLLRRLGCDVQAKNRLGLTWRAVKQELQKLR